MSSRGFIYFVESSASVSCLSLVSSCLFGGKGISCVRSSPSAPTPTGKPGFFFVPSSFSLSPDRYSFSEADQTWTVFLEPVEFKEIDGPCQIHCGYWHDLKPGPSDLWLGAGEGLKKSPVCLGDGNDWYVPILMFYSGEIAVERSYSIDRLGSPVLKPAARYRDLCVSGKRVFDIIYGIPGASGMTPNEYFDFISGCLGLLYGVSKTEVLLLELITESVASVFLGAVVDLPSLLSFSESLDKVLASEKKKDT